MHQSDLSVCYAWQVGELKRRNRKLKLNLQERRAQRKELQGKVQHADSQWSQAAANYEHLQASVLSMRCSLEVHPCALHPFKYLQCLYQYELQASVHSMRCSLEVDTYAQDHLQFLQCLA